MLRFAIAQVPNSSNTGPVHAPARSDLDWCISGYLRCLLTNHWQVWRLSQRQANGGGRIIAGHLGTMIIPFNGCGGSGLWPGPLMVPCVYQFRANRGVWAGDWFPVGRTGQTMNTKPGFVPTSNKSNVGTLVSATVVYHCVPVRSPCCLTI